MPQSRDSAKRQSKCMQLNMLSVTRPKIGRDNGLALTRIFYATDVHGSEKTYVKFLNAASFYKSQILILGGDITEK